MKIYIGLNGEGLGHYSRAVAIYEEAISQGHEAIMATYGNSYQKAISENIKVIEVPREVAMEGREGRFVLGKTILKSVSLPLRLYRAYQKEKELIKNYDVVVSDCRIATMMAGHKSKKPVFLVCNQTKSPKIEICNNKKSGWIKNLKEVINLRIAEWAMDLSCMVQYHWADEILIGDFQSPNTITLPLLSERPSVKKRTRIVGPLNRLVNGYEKISWESLGFKNNQPNVFMTVGGQAFRMGLIPKLLAMAKNLNANVLFSHFTIEKETRNGNIVSLPFSKEVYGYMAKADLIVVPAGHSGIMELLIMEIPGVLIPDGGQPEQISNSQQFKSLGFGEFITHEEIDQLENKVKYVLNNLSVYKSRFNGINQLAKTTNHGPKNALKKITDAYKKYYSK